MRIKDREIIQLNRSLDALETNFAIKINLFKGLAEESAKQKRYLSYLMKHSGDFIVFTDKNRAVVYISDSFLKALSVESGYAEGKNLYEIYSLLGQRGNDFSEVSKEKFAEAVRAKDTAFYDYDLDIGAGGSLRFFRISDTPIFDDNNELAGSIVTLFDSSDLIEAKRAAELANQTKSKFLATMSHEIRTPMNAIIGISQMIITSSELPEKIAEGVNKIYYSGYGLLGIINDILDLSKIENGKLEIDKTPYDLPSVNNDSAQLNIVRIKDKPIEFSLDIDPNLPANLIGDELRIKQILNNLLSNAIKYTDKGRVILKCYFEDIDDDNINLVFSVSDTGQGMKPEDTARLFSEYSRFNKDVNRANEGTGLGLSITKKLTELMGGSISVVSEYGEGSTFTVKLLQKKSGAAVIGSVQADKLRGFDFQGARKSRNLTFTYSHIPHGKILLVDDVETNLYVAEGLIAPYKIRPDTVSSGQGAIDLIKSGKTYDFIFMDHMMPKMDGVEATKILRGMGYTKPIVALTANAISGSAQMFMDNGFDGFISKPIDVYELDAALKKFVPKSSKSAAGDKTDIQPNSSDKKIKRAFINDSKKVSKQLMRQFLNRN